MVTKGHKRSRRRAADEQADKHAPPSPTITPRQQQALHALLTGATDTEAAEAANVTRETVNRWRHRDANFVAALSEARTNLSQHFHDGPLVFWRNRHAATSSLSTQFRYNPKPRCKPSVR